MPNILKVNMYVNNNNINNIFIILNNDYFNIYQFISFHILQITLKSILSVFVIFFFC